MSANVTFQDVIDEVMLEETEPTYQALARWQKLYPKWRDSLAEYFAEWALEKTQTPEASADIDAGIDEDAIVEKTIEYAMDTLARQGRLIPENSSEPLRPLDRMVLAAIIELQGRAEAVHVSDWVDNTAGKSVSLGAVFSALDRLENRDLIEYGPATPGTDADAGDSEQYVIMATMAGERALAHAVASSTAADFLGDLS
jgi:hypothetical protein